MSSYLINEFIYIPSLALFIYIYILSFIFVINMDDWILIWLGLELNILSYIVLIYKRYDINTLEACLKYFLIQSIGSALFLFFFYCTNVIAGILIIILSLKIGGGPFYYWFPSMCLRLEWLSCYVLITFQKVLPLLLMSGFVYWLLWVVVLLSLVIGVFGAFNQNNIKQLFAYSSVHHLGWIISSIFGADLFWLWYLFIYSIVLLSLVSYFMKYEVGNTFLLGKLKDKLWLILGMIRMAGLPPLLGFYLKWVAFIYILNVRYIYCIFLVVVSVIILYIYIRVVYDILLYNRVIIGWYNWSLNLGYSLKTEYLNLLGFIVGLILSLSLLI